MSNNFAKLGTSALEAKLNSTKTPDTDKVIISALLEKRQAKPDAANPGRPVKVEAGKKVPPTVAVGATAEFTTRTGLFVKGLIMRIELGKRDGKQYIVVRMDGKTYYKQYASAKLS